MKGEDNGWDDEPRVRLQVRHTEHFEERTEEDWPIPDTRWTRLNLHPVSHSLDAAVPTGEDTVSFDALGYGVTFFTDPLEQDTEITGPAALELMVSSSTTDADLFAVLRDFDPDDVEVVYQGAIDPHTPIGQGWLRVSHRKLDPMLSTSWRPYHAHDEPWPLTPGEPVPVKIEIWPTCIVVPAGHRVALTLLGHDYEYAESTGARLSNFKNELRGCGPFLHDDARDRPAEIFAGTTTVHLGPQHSNFLLLPIIPAR